MADYNPLAVAKVELLNGTNYNVWAMKIAAILRGKKLYKEVIEAQKPEMCDDITKPEFTIWRTWEEKNNEAFGIIVLSLATEQAGMFISETSAQRVWNELKTIYAGGIEDRIIDISLELKNLNMGKSESVDSYITRARSIKARSAALGEYISEREIVFHTVRGLNPKLEGIASVLRPLRSAKLEEVQQHLREEEQRIINTEGSISVNRVQQERAFRGRESNKNKRKIDKRCYVCNKVGHIAKQCWHKVDSSRNDMYKTREDKNINKDSKRKEFARIAEEKKEKQYAFRVHEGEMKDDEWNLDSGCTSHMTFRKDWMLNIENYNDEIGVAEDDRSISATARGEIKAIMKTEIGNRIVNMEDVLFVPKLRANLMSVKKLAIKGYKIIFFGNGAKIYAPDGELVAEAHQKNNMYVVNCEVYEGLGEPEKIKESETKSELKIRMKENDKELWHKRLGHPSEKYMNLMTENDMLRGVKYSKQQQINCDSCICGKFTQTPYNQIIETKETHVLEQLHIDLCGPLQIDSIGKSRYIFMIVDGYSRRMFVYFLKKKSEAFDTFLEFKNRRENETKMKIKRVRSDNGKEFVNNDFIKLFKDSGIKHELTVAYSAPSNGVAERANRTILDKARTLLIDAKLPIYFWAEAVATAVYLKNMTYSKRNYNQTAMERWNGGKPTGEHLKVFGCRAYYYIPNINRGKMDPRARTGIFTGYSRQRKAYRIYDPVEHKIKEVRSVKFDENRIGSDLINDQDSIPNVCEELKYCGEMDVEINSNKDDDTNEQMLIPVEAEEIPADIVTQNNEIQRNAKGRPIGATQQKCQEEHVIKRRENEQYLLNQGVRRSDRLKDTDEANIGIEIKYQTPKNYRQVEGSLHEHEWKHAMDNEIQSLIEHKVWTMVKREPGMRVVPSRWVYSVKSGENGEIYKARLVAMGNKQEEGRDYTQTYAPVLKIESMRTLLAIAAHKHLKLKKFDVKTAYLNSELKETIYMDPPEGYRKTTNEVCLLKKSIYGLPQSGFNWNKKMDEVLKSIGLTRMVSDPCVYQLKRGGEMVIIGLYVDDGMILGTSDNLIDTILEQIRNKFEITVTKDPDTFLGIEIVKSKRGYKINQKKYIYKLLDKYGMTNCNSVKTPMDPNQKIDEHSDSKNNNIKEYQELMGELMYISNATRPDITFSVNRLAQYMQQPKEMHYVAAKRILRYLKGTVNRALNYSTNPGKMEACTDASWNATWDAKSHTGMNVTIGTSVVIWKTRKQEIVALSTCESELIAMCDTVKEVMWLKNLLNELDLMEYTRNPTIIYTDSQATINWIKGVGVNPRTKHVGRKYYFVKDELAGRTIQLCHKPSQEIEADMLTKPLNAIRLEKCCELMGLKGKLNDIDVSYT